MVDLESFRQSRGMTYAELASLLGISQARQASAYARGEKWPRPELLQRIIDRTGGEVSVDAMHQTRLAAVRNEAAPQAAE